MARVGQYKALGSKLGGYRRTLSDVGAKEYAKQHESFKGEQQRAMYSAIGGTVANIIGIAGEAAKLKELKGYGESARQLSGIGERDVEYQPLGNLGEAIGLGPKTRKESFFHDTGQTLSERELQNIGYMESLGMETKYSQSKYAERPDVPFEPTIEADPLTSEELDVAGTIFELEPTADKPFQPLPGTVTDPRKSAEIERIRGVGEELEFGHTLREKYDTDKPEGYPSQTFAPGYEQDYDTAGGRAGATAYKEVEGAAATAKEPTSYAPFTWESIESPATSPQGTSIHRAEAEALAAKGTSLSAEDADIKMRAERLGLSVEEVKKRESEGAPAGLQQEVPGFGYRGEHDARSRERRARESASPTKGGEPYYAGGRSSSSKVFEAIKGDEKPITGYNAQQVKDIASQAVGPERADDIKMALGMESSFGQDPKAEGNILQIKNKGLLKEAGNIDLSDPKAVSEFYVKKTDEFTEGFSGYEIQTGANKGQTIDVYAMMEKEGIPKSGVKYLTWQQGRGGVLDMATSLMEGGKLSDGTIDKILNNVSEQQKKYLEGIDDSQKLVREWLKIQSEKMGKY